MSEYDEKGTSNYNWVLGPTLRNENTYRKHQFNLFKLCFGFILMPWTVHIVLAILGVGEEGYLVAFIEDDDNYR